MLLSVEKRSLYTLHQRANNYLFCCAGKCSSNLKITSSTSLTNLRKLEMDIEREKRRKLFKRTVLKHVAPSTNVSNLSCSNSKLEMDIESERRQELLKNTVSNQLTPIANVKVDIESERRWQVLKKTVLYHLTPISKFEVAKQGNLTHVTSSKTLTGMKDNSRNIIPDYFGNKLQSHKDSLFYHFGQQHNSCQLFPQIEDHPKHTLHSFFEKVTNVMNSSMYMLNKPSFSFNWNSIWNCRYVLQLHNQYCFSANGNNKKEASNKAALAAVQWLKNNHYIDNKGNPLLQSGLKLNGLRNHHQVLRYSTSSKLDSSTQAEIKGRTINPKNVLHNCFISVCSELNQKDLKVEPQYKLVKQDRKISWTCTYNLKWPEVMKFSITATSKQEASTKAAEAALFWLREINKISKDGLPLIYDKQEINKITRKTFASINLNSITEERMNSIVDLYDRHFVSQAVESLQEDTNEITSGSEELKERWPETSYSSRLRKVESLNFYVAKEPVELPITKYRNNIIELLRDNRVVIVKGEPGCGKSTRVPQYVLEAWAKSNDVFSTPCRIIVTQPRRIAAISLAERVADERGESVGGTVGYHVRLDSNFNKYTGRIMYCTTGILLRRLQSDPTLSDCSHVILDEAHERDVNVDLLMNLLKYALDLNPHLKLLVMSATLDTKLFQDYFSNAPVIHIPGFTYPVEQRYLTDEGNNVDLVKTYQMCQTAYPTVIFEDVVRIIQLIHKKRPDGAILCFLPGWDEIMKVKNLLPQRSDMVVVCLHSKLQVSDQRKIFLKPPPGVRKIILSTNIAETSVTINDVGYVVDTGIHKEERFDAEKGVSCIDNYWISQASAIQRGGRAGRCQAGECFHLYPENKFNQFPAYSIPEILRTSLTKIVLDSKVYSNNLNAEEFMQKLICPPERNAIRNAVDELKELELLDQNENLTPLGRKISDFQLSPKLAKAMVNAVIFKCVTPIVDIATLYSGETSLFAKTLVDKEGIKDMKRNFSKTSDHLALMNLFEKWLAYVENRDIDEANEFCDQTGMVYHKLLTVKKLRGIHMGYLRDGLNDVLPLSDDLSDNNELVKGVMLSGVGTILHHRTWDILKQRLKTSNVFITRHNQKATITSESVNSRRGKFPSDFLLYINETVSNLRHTTLVRETSVISPLAVLLFKMGELEIEPVAKEDLSDQVKSTDQVLLKLKGSKITFICDRIQALAIKQCKEALRGGMKYYTFQLTRGNDHNENLNQHWQDILYLLNDILVDQEV